MSGVATAGIVVAAGEGERLQAPAAKAFITLGGEPLLIHAVRSLTACAQMDRVVAVVNPDAVARAGELLGHAGLHDTVVRPGGRTRTASVAQGLQACPAETTTVAVHDAARPLATVELIGRTLAGLEGPWTAVAPGVPVVDTLKLVDDDQETVVRTVDRRGLYGVQTPQVFVRDVLVDAHERLGDHASPDDLALVEQAGGAVRLVTGDRRNLKITHPDDLPVAETLLAGAHALGDAGGCR